MKGLYKLSEFPDAGTIRTYSTGFGALDPTSDRSAPYLQLYQGCFMIVSGLPGGGETTWTTQLAFNMARLHGWRAAIASFEMRVTPTLRDMLRGFYIAEQRDLFQNPSGIPENLPGRAGRAARFRSQMPSSRSSSRSSRSIRATTTPKPIAVGLLTALPTRWSATAPTC